MHTVVLVLLVTGLLLCLTPIAIYLAALTVAALCAPRRATAAVDRERRFAVLVPAHNEAPVIGRLLRSLTRQSYPAEMIDICVIADNCTDDTGEIARAHGARVFERTERLPAGKGHALAWLLAALGRTQTQYDAYIVLDADTVVEPDFIEAMNRRLAGGARIVQAYYTVLPMTGTRTELLREAALALVHYLRPLAKTVLKASAGLKGNGMCFDAPVIARFGWPAAGLAEDVEFHLMLMEEGLRVTFAPEIMVRAEMPATLAAARSQNARWEAGRLTALRRQALPLLRQGIARRNVAMIDAALEQCVPPLSLPVTIATVGLLAGAVMREALPVLVAGLFLGLVCVHVVVGLTLARVPLRVYGALLYAPVYMAWKTLLYANVLMRRTNRTWVRTQRIGSP